MKFRILIIVTIAFFIWSCSIKSPSKQSNDASISFQNDGHEKVYASVQKMGDLTKLADKKNVSYIYTYQTPDGKKDVSRETYLFDGELSHGLYKIHERTFPELEGVIEQSYDGTEFWLKNEGVIVDDKSHEKRLVFNRKTNYYWFCMMPKLLDPGIKYEYLGEKYSEDQKYDVVKISFNSDDDKPTDIYQLYINKETQLIDKFLFTVADFGVLETPRLMVLEYEEINGLMIPTKRKYKKSTWDAEVSDEPWIEVSWKEIKFNNDILKDYFIK